jgi:hypothetical protein
MSTTAIVASRPSANEGANVWQDWLASDPPVGMILAQLLADEQAAATSTWEYVSPLVLALDSESALGQRCALASLIGHETAADEPQIPISATRAAKIQWSQRTSRMRRLLRVHQQQERDLQAHQATSAALLRSSDPHARTAEWQRLKTLDAPPSAAVTAPEARPVTISEASELQPLLDFLSGDGRVDAGAPLIEFPRGTVFAQDSNSSVQRLDLCKNVVGPRGAAPLFDAIGLATHVRHILLGNNITGRAGAQVIHDFLTRADTPSRIETWYLGGQSWSGDDVALVTSALETDTVATSLWLKLNPLGVMGARHIRRLLERNTTLRVLDLDNTGLGDEGLNEVLQGLARNKTLRHIYLNGNGITPRGAQMLADYLAAKPKGESGLAGLWLGVNRLDDAGVALVAEAIGAHAPGLEKLCLSSNRFGVPGTEAVCRHLAAHPALVYLGLGYNKATHDLVRSGEHSWRERHSFLPPPLSPQLLFALEGTHEGTYNTICLVGT